MLFPDDASGDLLRRMEAKGDDLNLPRNIDFAIVFADGGSAEKCAEHFHTLGHEVLVTEAETDQEFPWDVIVFRHMSRTPY